MSVSETTDVVPGQPTPAEEKQPTPAEPLAQPSLDTNKLDDLGAKKSDVVPIGPRGPHMPADAFTHEEREAKEKAADAKAGATMASTEATDSRGHDKGAFAVTPQGHDRHGARIPDKVDYTKPVDPPAIHGPRGPNAPKDTFTS